MKLTIYIITSILTSSPEALYGCPTNQEVCSLCTDDWVYLITEYLIVPWLPTPALSSSRSDPHNASFCLPWPYFPASTWLSSTTALSTIHWNVFDWDPSWSTPRFGWTLSSGEREKVVGSGPLRVYWVGPAPWKDYKASFLLDKTGQDKEGE